MAKGREAGEVAPAAFFGPRAQLGAAQAGGWRVGSGGEIRRGGECSGN